MAVADKKIIAKLHRLAEAGLLTNPKDLANDAKYWSQFFL